MIPIDDPIPLADEGDPAWCLSAERLNHLARKINAMYSMRAVSPVRITKSDSGFVIHTSKTGLLPDDDTIPTNAEPAWEAVSVCIDGVTTTVYVYAWRVPA